MACPLEINMHNLIGSFDMNKKIGDNTAPVLKMQGLSWIVRQAVSYSAIQVNLKQYTDDDGVVHIDQEQVSTGGVKQTELRVLNGEWAERDVDYWGFVTGWNKFIKVSEIEDEYLKQDWLEEGEADRRGDVLMSYNESPKRGWNVYQVWGFAIVDGKRMHVRRIVSKKGREEHRIRTVYDYKTES